MSFVIYLCNILLHCAILQQHHIFFIFFFSHRWLPSFILSCNAFNLFSSLTYAFLPLLFCILHPFINHTSFTSLMSYFTHSSPFSYPLSLSTISTSPGIESEWIKGYEDAMLALGEQSFPLNLVFRRGLMHALSDTGASVAQGSLVRSRVCVCACMCLCLCVHVCMCVCIACMHLCVSVCMCMHSYVCVCVCMCLCMHLCACMHVCVLVCVFVWEHLQSCEHTHMILLHSISLLTSTPLYCDLLYTTLLCCTVFYSTPLYSTLI